MYGYPCVLACFHLNAPENSSPRRDSEVFGFQLPHIWNYLLSSCITRIPIVTERHHIYHDLIFPPPKNSCRYFVRYRGGFFLSFGDGSEKKRRAVDSHAIQGCGSSRASRGGV